MKRIDPWVCGGLLFLPQISPGSLLFPSTPPRLPSQEPKALATCTSLHARHTHTHGLSVWGL